MDFENIAVDKVILAHGLSNGQGPPPSADGDLGTTQEWAVQTWGATTPSAALWDLIEQAVDTPSNLQTFDQVNVAAWFQNSAAQQQLLAFEDARLEYAEYQGYGASRSTGTS